MTIGQRIKAARKKENLTQSQLAELLGLSTITVRQYEADKREPRYQIIEKIANTLHCDISDIVDSKKEAQMILDQLCGIDPEKMTVEEDTLLSDALEEGYGDISIAQRYTRFIVEHPQLMQALKEIGIELEIIDWHRIRIKHDYQESEERTSELLSDLESLHESYMHSLTNLFKNNYGFDMGEEA